MASWVGVEGGEKWQGDWLVDRFRASLWGEANVLGLTVMMVTRP